MNTAEKQQFTEIVLQKVKLGLTHTVCAGLAAETRIEDISDRVGWMADDMVLQLVTRVTSQKFKEETITLDVSYPATWWDHFKQRWFPSSWQRRWPVRMKREQMHVTLAHHIHYPEYVLPKAGPTYYQILPHTWSDPEL